jgi:hypothetical protein
VDIIWEKYSINFIEYLLTFFFLQSFTQGRNYFVAQYPLPETIGDFWSLNDDNDCESVVVMELSDKVLIQCWTYVKYYMYLDNLFEWYFTIVNHECVSACYLTPNYNLFNYIMAKTRYISMFIKMISPLYLGQQAKLEFHGAGSLKQLSMHTFLFTRRHYPVSVTTTFYFYSLNCVLNRESSKHQSYSLWSWSDWASNPRVTGLESIMLTMINYGKQT